MRRKRRRLELGKTLFLLPNLITLSSIFCGFDAIRLAARGSEDDIYRAAVLLIFAMFFDMLDGRVARMTKTQSAFGLQIDSLADVVSFGVAPALLVYQWTLHRLGTPAWSPRSCSWPAARSGSRASTSSSMGESGKPNKPVKYIVGLPDPGRGRHPRVDRRRQPRRRRACSAAPSTPGRSSASPAPLDAMVSTIRFRSFKDLKLNLRTVALRRPSRSARAAVISAQLKPAFVLVWLLGFYVMLGIFEVVWQLVAQEAPHCPRLDSAAWNLTSVFCQRRFGPHGLTHVVRTGAHPGGAVSRCFFPIGEFCLGFVTPRAIPSGRRSESAGRWRPWQPAFWRHFRWSCWSGAWRRG